MRTRGVQNNVMMMTVMMMNVPDVALSASVFRRICLSRWTSSGQDLPGGRESGGHLVKSRYSRSVHGCSSGLMDLCSSPNTYCLCFLLTVVLNPAAIC